MPSLSNIVVISLFGRGHYIASLLSQNNYKVKLINLSGPKLQSANIENIIGPFDFFKNYLDSLQNAFLDSFIKFKNTSSGFTLWSKLGPIDFQSFIKNYSIENCGLSVENIEYLANANLLSSKEKKNLQASLSDMSHLKNWLSKLAHQLPSSRWQLDSYDLKKSNTNILDLFNKKQIAQAACKTLQNSLDWCQSNSVEVISVDDDLSILKKSNKIQSISYTNLKNKKKETILCDQVIWTAHSKETKSLYPKIFLDLYKKALVPQWHWQKITIHINSKYQPDFINDSFVMLNNLELNFSGDNLAIVKKTVMPDVWQLWMLLPYKHKSNLMIKNAANAFFKERIPKLKIEKIDIPDKNVKSFFPVFSADDKICEKTINNIHFCNFEHCHNLDWPGFLNFQKNMANKILTKDKAL